MNTTGGIETVLAGHQRRVDNGACWCGQWPTEQHDETWSAHVAAAVRAHLLSDAVVTRSADAVVDVALDDPCRTGIAARYARAALAAAVEGDTE